jgi:hypothetical protein
LFKALKSPLFKGNSTGLISTALTNTAPTSTTLAGILISNIINDGINKTDVNTDPYKLNKLNTGKLGFIKDKEMIIRHKFKYFRKGDKKG